MKFTAFGFMQISLIELLWSALVMLVMLVNRELSSAISSSSKNMIVCPAVCP